MPISFQMDIHLEMMHAIGEVQVQLNNYRAEYGRNRKIWFMRAHQEQLAALSNVLPEF